MLFLFPARNSNSLSFSFLLKEWPINSKSLGGMVARCVMNYRTYNFIYSAKLTNGQNHLEKLGLEAEESMEGSRALPRGADALER